MKRLLAVLLVAAALAAPRIAPAAPIDEYDDSESHPLRLVAYFVHPVGFAAKWLIVWPIHYVVAQPGLEEVFGHCPHRDYAFDEGCSY